VKAGLDISLD